MIKLLWLPYLILLVFMSILTTILIIPYVIGYMFRVCDEFDSYAGLIYDPAVVLMEWFENKLNIKL